MGRRRNNIVEPVDVVPVLDVPVLQKEDDDVIAYLDSGKRTSWFDGSASSGPPPTHT